MTAITIRRLIPLTALTLFAGACSDDNAQTQPAEQMATPPMEEAPVPDAGPDGDLATAEAFIDAFYSFDPERLAPIMASAPETAPRLLYYQGWAEGGNYTVLERTPCSRDDAEIVNCPVKVKDDPVQALGTGFDVTDTFHLSFEEGVLVKVTTSSNDQEIYGQARDWVAENMPEVMEGPCANRNTLDGTPGDCARAMTAGYAAFVESSEFPGVPPLPTD